LVLDDTWQEAKNISKYVALLCVVFLYALPYRVVYRVLKIQKMLLIIEGVFLSFLLLVGTHIEFSGISSLLQLIVLLSVFQVLCTELASRRYMRLAKIKYEI
jgi:hypothetical protein